MKKSPDTIAADAAPSNAFAALLATHRRGMAGNKASIKLQEAILVARDTGAKAQVIVTVTLTPGADDIMTVNIQACNKLPDEKLPGGVFWVDDEGNLVTSDPNQKELPLREVIPVGTKAVAEAAKQA